ncbi:MAG: class A beta-lactamase-related serine hydrolase [Bacteroidetes bacterium]|nr:class A beta-lactamase-related serine hydrolase [Bacteroidota bacterium]
MRLLLICFLLLLTACQTENQNPIEAILAANPDLAEIAQNSKYEVQILYSDIIRQGDSVSFKDYSFRLDADQYYYPASTVKMPVAVLALEKLKLLRQSGIEMHRETPYIINGDTVSSNIATDVSEIFAVSDNSAFNRLYEFLGRDEINQKLHEKGIFPVRISHRLSVPNSAVDTTKTLLFFTSDSTFYPNLEVIDSPIQKLDYLKNQQKGIGFYAADSLVNTPFDFSLKNYYPLQSAHETLKRILFPIAFAPNERFDLSEDDHVFLVKTMAQLPSESPFKSYDPEMYYDSYVKFLMFGDSKAPMPKHIKVYNKVGDAYGTLTDIAYIKDEKNDVEFMLSATILVNSNDIFNDNTYDYDGIGFPFLGKLGRAVYEYKLD